MLTDAVSVLPSDEMEANRVYCRVWNTGDNPSIWQAALRDDPSTVGTGNTPGGAMAGLWIILEERTIGLDFRLEIATIRGTIPLERAETGALNCSL